MSLKVLFLQILVIVTVCGVAAASTPQSWNDHGPSTSPEGTNLRPDVAWGAGETLHERAWVPDSSSDKPKIAILVFDGVQIIDFTGPYEVFGQYSLNEVYTVAPAPGIVTTAMGMEIQPAYTFDDHPAPDVLVIPGGSIGQHRTSDRLSEWIRTMAAESRFVLSVCNGAFYLADAGLLDGLSATTFYGLLDKLEEEAPRTTVVDDRRFVDNGNVITSAGISSGIDAALHVISKLHGKAWAQAVALNMEYDWRPEAEYVRAQLADMNIPTSVYSVVMPQGQFLRYDGDREKWAMVWRIPNDRSAPEVLAAVERKLENEEESSWHKLRSGDRESRWEFVGRDGQTWRSRIRVSSAGSEALDVEMLIERKGTKSGWTS